MTNNKSHTGALILSGGNSSRMNYPKPFLPLGDKTFLQSIVETYRAVGIERIVVVVNGKFCIPAYHSLLEPIKTMATIIENHQPDDGRMHSILLGMKAMQDLDYCYIHNVDNPFVGKETIEELWQNRNENGYVKPTNKGRGGHPILISKTIIKQLDYNHDSSQSLKEMLAIFDERMMETADESILVNINTKEDYDAMIKQHEIVTL